LNQGYSLQKFLGGKQTLSEFRDRYGYTNFSKTVSVFEPERKQGSKIPAYKVAKEENKNKFGTYSSEGNPPIFDTASNLALACENFHKRELVIPTDNYLNYQACFPILFTNARLVKVQGEGSTTLQETNHFIYLVACRNLDMLPLTAKDNYYLPIMITNFDGIAPVVEMVSKIDQDLKSDVEMVLEHPDFFDNELKKYRELYVAINGPLYD